MHDGRAREGAGAVSPRPIASSRSPSTGPKPICSRPCSISTRSRRLRPRPARRRGACGTGQLRPGNLRPYAELVKTQCRDAARNMTTPGSSSPPTRRQLGVVSGASEGSDRQSWAARPTARSSRCRPTRKQPPDGRSAARVQPRHRAGAFRRHRRPASASSSLANISPPARRRFGLVPPTISGSRPNPRRHRSPGPRRASRRRSRSTPIPAAPGTACAEHRAGDRSGVLVASGAELLRQLGEGGAARADARSPSTIRPPARRFRPA